MIKKSTITALLGSIALSACLGLGYYETKFAEDNRIVFFIKKQPTLQIKFENIFLTDEDEKPLARLSNEDREKIIKYCKYRLGITTNLENQESLDACKKT